ncbi:uvrd / recb / pcra DNA helicase family member [Anaeramoeba flamelloides]|uniref:DNA 3'-5' helicase n=1 Tax=Anaeramoeba flamelloides TaxID=1746091 RepID=A0ABQ8Z5M7_9EUKA|nr:uvrd / recb / pcra DNA helicase family member [Anaeramoeba flamelloides]
MNLQPILQHLNPQQKEAVTSDPNEPLLIIAGCGSGKTTVLISRIAYLISQGVQPKEILAITFTKKASEEMKERVTRLFEKFNQTNRQSQNNNKVGDSCKDLLTCTFHSLGLLILREQQRSLSTIGLKPGFLIYGEKEQHKLLMECIGDFNQKYCLNLSSGKESFSKSSLDLNSQPQGKRGIISSTSKDLKHLIKYIRKQKAKGVSPTDIDLINKTLNSSIFKEENSQRLMELYEDRSKQIIYSLFTSKMLHSNAIDFCDMILKSTKLLKLNKGLLLNYRRRWQYLLVDEYQDIDRSQFELIRLLCEHSGKVTIVGDDDQCIYSFRGADSSNFQSFISLFDNQEKENDHNNLNNNTTTNNDNKNRNNKSTNNDNNTQNTTNKKASIPSNNKNINNNNNDQQQKQNLEDFDEFNDFDEFDVFDDFDDIINIPEDNFTQDNNNSNTFNNNLNKNNNLNTNSNVNQKKFKLNQVKLIQNYRSTKRIVSNLNRVIRENTKRISKTLITENEEGGKILIRKFQNEKLEAKFVVSEIRKILKSGKFQPYEIAVLFRSKHMLYSLNKEFKKYKNTLPISKKSAKKGIPYSSRNEVVDFCSILTIITQRNFSKCFDSLLQNEKNVGPKFISELNRFAKQSKLDNFTAANLICRQSLLKICQDSFFRTKKRVTILFKLLEPFNKINHLISEKMLSGNFQNDKNELLNSIIDTVSNFLIKRYESSKDYDKIIEKSSNSDLETNSNSNSDSDSDSDKKIEAETDNNKADSDSDSDSNERKTKFEDKENNNQRNYNNTEKKIPKSELPNLFKLNIRQSIGFLKNHFLNSTIVYPKLTEIKHNNNFHIFVIEKIKEFIDAFNLDIEEESNYTKKKTGKITLTTVHQSKGLEWGVVFVVRLNNGDFPVLKLNKLTMQEKNDQKFLDNLLEEERRLFYVAISRAKKKLYLSYLNIKSKGPSLFFEQLNPITIDEINEEQEQEQLLKLKNKQNQKNAKKFQRVRHHKNKTRYNKKRRKNDTKSLHRSNTVQIIKEYPQSNVRRASPLDQNPQIKKNYNRFTKSSQLINNSSNSGFGGFVSAKSKVPSNKIQKKTFAGFKSASTIIGNHSQFNNNNTNTFNNRQNRNCNYNDNKNNKKNNNFFRNRKY